MTRVRRLQGDDRGFTMLETVVGMVIMTIFMGIFTGAVVTMYSSANKAEALSNSTGQLNLAFDRLDKEIRYASYVGAPTLASDGNWYVVFQTTNTGTPVCSQLRLNKTLQQLQQRTWVVAGTAPNTSATSLTSWIPLASGITNGGAAAGSSTAPFTYTAASATVTAERLTIRLVALAGTAASASTSTTALTFVALNTALDTTTSGVCTEVGVS